jgi:hypothetical protein
MVFFHTERIQPCCLQMQGEAQEKDAKVLERIEAVLSFLPQTLIRQVIWPYTERWGAIFLALPHLIKKMKQYWPISRCRVNLRWGNGVTWFKWWGSGPTTLLLDPTKLLLEFSERKENFSFFLDIHSSGDIQLSSLTLGYRVIEEGCSNIGSIFGKIRLPEVEIYQKSSQPSLLVLAMEFDLSTCSKRQWKQNWEECDYAL